MSSASSLMGEAEETLSLMRDIEAFNTYGTQGDEDDESNSDEDDDDDIEQQQQQEEETPQPQPQEPTAERDVVIERLTRRLRCLFSAITWPIVPLGTLVAICLLWVLYAALVIDIRSTCSHPLHGYAFASLAFLSYAPNHAHVRSYLFHYQRERDGPIRPTRVRLYDQLFHTLCILYVYGGVTLLQACKQDGTGAPAEVPSLPNNNITTNVCEATCPHLYAALDVYVTMLELFTLSLIIPLLFLPCIYLYILRRVADVPSFWDAGETISTQELMESLEHVQVVEDQQSILIVHSDGSRVETDVRECCICMSELVQTEVIRTKCGHLFHAPCLESWISGSSRRARRTGCPLCRQDLRPRSS